MRITPPIRTLAGRFGFTLPNKRQRVVRLLHEPVHGRKSEKAVRLAEHCLGQFTSEPVKPCTGDRGYLEKKFVILLETIDNQIVMTAGRKLAAIKGEKTWDHKRVANAWINQQAAIPPGLKCWLVRADSAGRKTDPEQGLHLTGMRHRERRDLVLVPTGARNRLLGPCLERQLDEMRKMWIPWHEKTDTAWWGGALTGSNWRKRAPDPLTRRKVLLYFRDHPSDHVRLHLVGAAEDTLPHGVVPQGRFEKQSAFRHKCLVLLPGNDIASGSSWFFAGNSVVLMPEPHMDHILYFEMKAWEHFVPLENDPKDILTKLQWVLDHPRESRQIVANSHERLRWLSGPEYQWACNEVLRTVSP